MPAAAGGTQIHRLMEFIVTNVGPDLSVISPTVFIVLVIMAIVSTVITTPARRACLGPRPRRLQE